VEKDISLFSRNKRTKDGMRAECKECRKKITKIYRDNNKDKIKSDREKFNNNNKDYFKNYAINNKESLKEYRKEYLEINKEKITESKKDYNKNNRTKSNEYLKKYRSENKEKFKEYYNNSKETRKKYYEENKEKIKDKRNEYSRNYLKKRKSVDSLFKLSCNIRTIISICIKKKNRKFIKNSKTTDILGCSFEELKSRIESNFEYWMTWDNHGLYNGELNYGWDIDHIIPLSSATTEEDIIKLNHFSNLRPLCSKVNRDIKRNLI
jgi:hypothetical protein